MKPLRMTGLCQKENCVITSDEPSASAPARPKDQSTTTGELSELEDLHGWLIARAMMRGRSAAACDGDGVPSGVPNAHRREEQKFLARADAVRQAIATMDEQGKTIEALSAQLKQASDDDAIRDEREERKYDYRGAET